MASATLLIDIQQVVRGEHRDVFRVLGMHRVSIAGELRLVVRAFLPGAESASVVGAESEDAQPMERVHPDGFFELVLASGTHPFPYRLRVTEQDGSVAEEADPYSFAPTIADFDLYLVGEGTHLRLWDVLGAHPDEMDGVAGTRFAVWAPGARRVSVVGAFNGWDGRRHVMRFHPGSGVWEMFVPGVGAGDVYKYEIHGALGGTFLKADPVAFRSEHNPATASIVHDLSGFGWSDEGWMEARRTGDCYVRPMAVYEVHLGSWM